ncbi:NAD(P)H-quinone oxidoreductase [Roseisolibacter sp. H3M3-2]|uniref:NAD(P)H-quinone oxidoreductase n=1 Tax=Roseisolibacter sp. H3M3-2 TaxID=3031323 RepID=UPI0023DB9751|nr:NAD(P)H-quinone oxidoreductase [Roseisolibacter sp. H3M3-2]MDF1505589.1 NAD(P)H-quinone oxidoreductase [Roseisolibacter sp. H3M3-2]
MHAAVITRPGPPDVLQLRDVPMPAPGTEQILVRVRASALNRADLLQRRGGYPAPPGSPADVPGLEYAGEVAALGPGARLWKEGDRVFGLTGGGGHAEYLVVHERTAARVPDALSWAEAGAVPEAFMTAHDALWQANARPGETALVHAVASGVGLAAVQLARAFGLRPLGTARTASKLEAARALGMHAGLAVDRATADDPTGLGETLAAFVGAHVEGHGGARGGAHVALDLVGGAYTAATLHAMAPLGRLVLIGLVAGATAPLDLGRILRGRLTVRGTVMRARPLEERIATAMRFGDEVVPLLASGAVRATLDRTFPLGEIAAAHELLESNATVGKVGILIE